jgi:uncharacterized protein
MLDESALHEKLNEHFMAFWFTLIFGLFTFSIAWLNGFFKPFKASTLPYVTGFEVLMGFILFVLTQVVFVPFLIEGIYYLFTGEVLLERQLGSIPSGWISSLSILGGFLSVLVVYLRIPQERRQPILQQYPGKFLSNVKMGIIGWFISFPLVMAFNQIISILVLLIFKQSMVDQSAVRHLRGLLEHPFLFSLTTLEIVTLVPFTEELLFRGFLQSWLKRKLNSATIAIIFSSIVFALFHFSISQGISNIELLSALFLLSCFLGFLYEKQRSLWATVSMHAFFNLISVVMIFKEMG